MDKDGGTLSDSEMMEQAKADPAAFGLLYRRLFDRIYNYIYYRVGNQYDAEDLTARTFQRALANLKSYEDRGVPISAWFYRIAHNLVANFHRDRSRRKMIPLDSLVSVKANVEQPVASAMRSERRDELLSAIRKLPGDRQQLLLLKFNEHLSNAEIGEIMGRSESAIKSLYHRTLLSLRKELTDRGFSPEEDED